MSVSSSVMMQAIGSGALMQRSTVGGGKLRITPAPHKAPDENMATKANEARAANRGGGYLEGIGAASCEGTGAMVGSLWGGTIAWRCFSVAP